MASMIISTYSMFLPQRTMVFCAIALCILFFGIYIPYQERKKNRKQQPKKPPAKKPNPPKPNPIAKSAGNKELEQLKTLKQAGLLTEEEYRERAGKLK